MGRPRQSSRGVIAADEECTVARIRLHYERLGLAEGWELDRVYRLCKLLHCTAEELGALVNMSRSAFSAAVRKKRFAGEASLHFALLESAYLQTAAVMPVEMLGKKAETHHHD